MGLAAGDVVPKPSPLSAKVTTAGSSQNNHDGLELAGPLRMQMGNGSKRPDVREGTMKCQRCWRNEDATYRVRSDVIDIKVCAACADEALALGITVEVLDAGAGKGDAGKSEFELRDYRSELSPYCR